ncbi:MULTISPECIES: beta-N-acetylhexosaminidase [unclassified Ensifer]|uniref:beta-N-acetylhexosaminidase n=1 Tax=unclassified Ensifer TaxID=2633371 RepID=UPI00070D9500|nr:MULTISPECIES: beta-N-acetylhexosaminidase [unclassified Ensifer]KQW56743.1 beta-N-acetylhexosaminidase [Ensifer sp. Root127]KQW60373.1 beta-N-acetylhexosaminidase [Ensifer sp. Root1252]KRC77668.1 beta-N-acetylhexosaminidase [Ensifer sp. Root231]KRC99512.1 beta-N-acetylhexosaminidase [Ensifer sp. Root258]PSS64898.1 beta-N-acetylhexosaminidase [Ensifer sp. NM-2]
MAPVSYRLEASWQPDGGAFGRFTFTLFNFSATPLTGFRLVYTSLTRVIVPEACDNATFLRRNANFHEFAPPAGLTLGPGESWTFTVSGLHRQAKHCTDGAKSAYLTFSSGEHVPVAVSDLLLENAMSEPPPAQLPEGKLDLPFSMQPWPAQIDAWAGDSFPVVLYPAPMTAPDDVAAVASVLGLFHRLFSAGHAPFSLVASSQGRAIVFSKNATLAAEAYELAFSTKEIRLAYGGAAGRQYALTTLAQLLNGARTHPEKFRFPAQGTISDAPRYGWRGCHLDVSRQFYPTSDISRLIDILAWFKLNIFHWHLTDDEAWRLEIKAFPTLTTIGVLRGPDEPLLPQLGNGAEPAGGFYSQEDVKALVAQATALHVEIVPEIDIPGHSTATLVALPDLTDGQEAPESYHSVQGYPNNALNPAIAFTYDFLEKVLDEMVELFPSQYIHIGGDEVANGSWLASPLAKKLMEKEGLSGTFALQSFFLKKVKQMLTVRGRKLAGWNEVAHGGGVETEGTLLMAWERPEVGIELAREGYDVVMTPGQAYYLDMAQADAWQEPGASWAGTATSAHTYGYEAEGEFPDELKARMKGVQACIWSEHFLSRGYFNRLVFPRLCAIAEAAWTPKSAKDWQRFAAIAPLSPKL